MVIMGQIVPEAIERVRIGWQLIGYDVPVGWRSVYFAYVAPEIEHVHLGFQHGVLMDDPDGLLLGAGVTKRVRWLTVRAIDEIPPTAEELLREAARLATLTRSEHMARLLDREELAAATRSR